jgi:hypothetical protein
MRDRSKCLLPKALASGGLSSDNTAGAGQVVLKGSVHNDFLFSLGKKKYSPLSEAISPRSAISPA